ncbi:MAG: bifunctional oligoribonuclease/PAP phosphatase NrnA [Nitrospirae bacterium]|nr:bifunctional oligoribonuclease/PAP phosphatase NrnA [Nitrospirota bacterium]
MRRAVKIKAELLTLIKNNGSFLIVSHFNPDGDAVGSSIALAMGLKKLGKKVHIANRDKVPDALAFLPSSGLVGREAPEGVVDVLCVVDCNTMERTGLKNLKASKTIVMDHHIMPDNAGELWDNDTLNHSIIDPGISATGEIVFSILSELGVVIDKDMAVNLYTALLYDTGGFRYANTTPESLSVASRLVAAGAEPWRITKELYESVPYNAMKLLAAAYKTIEKDGKMAWMTVTKEMLAETGTTAEHTENFVDYPRKIKGVEVAVFFREEADDLCKVSLRSKGGINVQKIAAIFGGGGHAPAAGCTVKGPLNEVTRRILDAVREALRKS